MSDEAYYCVEIAEVMRESDDAIHVRIDSDDVTLAYEKTSEIWIPKSQIVDSSTVTEVGDEGELHVTMWLAQERGWF